MIALADTGQIGATALYLLLIWLASAAGAAWLADRKGYGERLGLTFGLVLTFVGFILVLLLPGRPGSAWKLEGPFPRRRAARASGSPPPVPAASPAPPASSGSSEPSGPPPPGSPPPGSPLPGSPLPPEPPGSPPPAEPPGSPPPAA